MKNSMLSKRQLDLTVKTLTICLYPWKWHKFTRILTALHPFNVSGNMKTNLKPWIFWSLSHGFKLTIGLWRFAPPNASPTPSSPPLRIQHPTCPRRRIPRHKSSPIPTNASLCPMLQLHLHSRWPRPRYLWLAFRQRRKPQTNAEWLRKRASRESGTKLPFFELDPEMFDVCDWTGF